ncbi:hypothetical protein MRB53_005915 [Persea americana]|uniref:Uncharacterized protein n=1 Tax=Persea americana TaxID=3435 RepID=A0ACC2MEP3_PERAE|nr:hypothetical protein MRB53_005915 [Persea americana]
MEENFVCRSSYCLSKVHAFNRVIFQNTVACICARFNQMALEVYYKLTVARWYSSPLAVGASHYGLQHEDL